MSRVLLSLVSPKSVTPKRCGVTLVARLQIDDYPILLGDIALSSASIARPPAQVPTIGDTSKIFPSGCDKIVSGLCQKLAVIGGNLAIGFSGPRAPIARVITELVCGYSAPVGPSPSNAAVGASAARFLFARCLMP